MKLNKIATSLIVIFIVIFALIWAKNFLIPLVLAFLIWFLIKETRDQIRRIPYIGKLLPKWLLTFFSMVVLFSLIFILTNIVVTNINDLLSNIDSYQLNLAKINMNIISEYHIDMLDIWEQNKGSFELSTILKQIINGLSDFVSNAFMIVLYVLFLFIEESAFRPKLKALFPESGNYQQALENISKINESIGSYISLKTIVSLITGLTSYIALLFIGIDSPFFWALIIFVLNFIPTIGSLIATAFPAMIAFLQYGEFTYLFIVLGIVGAIQLVVGNFIEPKIMGNSLNISPLVVIISLSFWGLIWGIIGMILSVPIMVILILFLANFKETKPLAILLSDKGNV